MALNKIYTDNTVIKRSNGGTLAWVATKPYNELFGENEFDLSILLNNSSTSKMLNNGAYGKNPTKYLDLRTIASGEPTVPIQFLGCFLSTTDSISVSYGFNITKKTPFINENLGGDSWQQFINNFRFVIDFIPATNNISYETYQDFDYNNTTAVKYGFGTSYIEFSAEYKTANISTSSSTTKNPELISGDDAKRFVYSNAYVTTTNYNKYLEDNTQLTKEWLCLLWYAFRVNGDLIIIRYPEYMPTSGEYRTRVELPDGTYEFLTIGGFSDTVIDGTTGGLPENDDTKGLYVSYLGRGSNYYYSTNNAIMHNTNSSGIRWTVNEITTAKNFRDYVRLGVMDANGLITHNEWIVGETGIANSENPNKNGSYSDLPEWKPSGGGDEDELEDSEITLNANGNSFIKWFAVTGQNLLSLIDSFNSESVPAGFVPLDHIVGVYQAPFNIPEFSNCGTLTNIFVGKYDTNVQGMPLLNQGSYSTTGIIASKYIEPTHNNFLDYEPYTSLSLYLPFCGSCNLDANLFVGKTVNVDYYFDIFSGDVIANVYANGTLYKTLSGNFTISQPITSQNVGLQKDTVIKGAVGVATNMLGTAGFAMSGNISGALSGAVGATISSISTYTHLNGISPVATKGGGGRSIFYTCKNIILYKSTAIENHGAYEKYRGKVCNYDSKLSECHGYTVVDNPHIEIKCTNTEKDEITKLLEQGVILP